MAIWAELPDDDDPPKQHPYIDWGIIIAGAITFLTTLLLSTGLM